MESAEGRATLVEGAGGEAEGGGREARRGFGAAATLLATGEVAAWGEAEPRYSSTCRQPSTMSDMTSIPSTSNARRKTTRDGASFSARESGDAPLGDGRQFGTVLATGILHHLDETEADQLFRSARAQAKERGRLLIYDPVSSCDPPTPTWRSALLDVLGSRSKHSHGGGLQSSRVTTFPIGRECSGE